MKCVSHFCNYYKVQHSLMAKLKSDSKKNLDKLQIYITTVVCPGFFETDVTLTKFCTGIDQLSITF